MRTLERVLPEWLDADRLNNALLGGVACLALAGFVALRLIRRMALALTVFALLVGGAVLLALQWESLRDCQLTCTCEVLGQTVTVPDVPLCGPDRIDPRDIDPERFDIDFDNNPGSG